MADDWIVEHLQPDDVVVTNDIPLADRCLKKGACAIKPTGKVYTENSIGDALATRDLLTEHRSAGVVLPPTIILAKLSRTLQVMVYIYSRFLIFLYILSFSRLPTAITTTVNSLFIT